MNLEATHQSTDNASSSAASWSWLKSISKELYHLDQSPLLGHPPLFPWQQLAKEFAKCFDLASCEITPGELQWKAKADILKGLTEPYMCVQLGASGIEGTLSFWLCKADIEHLMSQVLQLPFALLKEQEAEMVEAFYQFLSVQTIFLINQLEFDKRLSFKISSYETPDLSDALCQDIHITCGNEAIFARLVISPEFRANWSQFFSKSRSSIPQLEAIPIITTLEAGRTSLMLPELMQIRPGDFLVCDHIFFSPDDENSRLLLTLEGRTIFRAKLKDGNLKILEIPLHNEVYDSMVDKISSSSPLEGPSHKLPPDLEEDPFADEEDEETEESDALTDTDIEQPVEPAAKAAVKPAAKKQQAALTGQITAQDIPVTVILELAKIEMSAQKLIELQPGNLLDTDISPEGGVHLVVNGKTIGKGELLRIGETIGVRILEIGV